MASNDGAIKAWFAMRREAIHDNITAHDVLRLHGVSFRHTTDREEQFSCPFHGQDNKPSARVYPAKGDSKSHVWCFVCQQPWDAISLWKKFSGDEKKHHQILIEMERHLGIGTPEVPEGAHAVAQVDDGDKVNYGIFLELCEHRLKEARESYVAQDDMNGFLIAGSILDKLITRVSEGRLQYARAIELLKQLIDKIGDRIRGETA